MFVFKSFILILAIVFNSSGVRSQNSKYNKSEIFKVNFYLLWFHLLLLLRPAFGGHWIHCGGLCRFDWSFGLEWCWKQVPVQVWLSFRDNGQQWSAFKSELTLVLWWICPLEHRIRATGRSTSKFMHVEGLEVVFICFWGNLCLRQEFGVPQSREIFWNYYPIPFFSSLEVSPLSAFFSTLTMKMAYLLPFEPQGDSSSNHDS